MKSFMVFVFIIVWSASIGAQSKQTTISEEREIPLQVLKEKPKRTRSTYRLVVYAHLYNNVVSIDFLATFSTAIITITYEATGETVYSKTCTNPTNLNINLGSESSGSYFIEIEADDTHFIGSFSL